MLDVKTLTITKVMMTYSFWHKLTLSQQGFLPLDACSYIFSFADTSAGVAQLAGCIRWQNNFKHAFIRSLFLLGEFSMQLTVQSHKCYSAMSQQKQRIGMGQRKAGLPFTEWQILQFQKKPWPWKETLTTQSLLEYRDFWLLLCFVCGYVCSLAKYI